MNSRPFLAACGEGFSRPRAVARGARRTSNRGTVSDPTHQTRRAPRLLALLAALVCALALPVTAEALTVEKLSARPNADAGNDVLGATETRITWEAQADDGEALTSVSLTLPEGTAYELDDARATVLAGADLMDRVPVDASFSADGQTVTADFSEALPAGSYLRLEIYGVEFPAAGGELELAGSYALADGSERDLPDMPAISVTGVSAVDAFVSDLEQQEWVQAWNSNKFLRLFLNPPILVSSVPIVFSGFLMALAIVLLAFPLAIPLGFLLALMRTSKLRLLRAIASVYVNIVRGTPAFLQIYIAFFGLPLAGIQVPTYPLGVVVMALNSSAYLCEIFRAGIQSIPKGQFEAARSLGMNGVQTMLYVIIPQMFRSVIPTMTSEFILLYKDTSLLAAVGVMEVVMYAKTIVASTGSITPYIVAALFYLVITLPLARVVSMLEARLNGGGRGSDRRERRLDVAQTPSAHESGM